MTCAIPTPKKVRLTWRPDRLPAADAGWREQAREALYAAVSPKRGVRYSPPVAIALPCDFCGAHPGQPCMDLRGFVAHTHVSRLQAADLSVIGHQASNGMTG